MKNHNDFVEVITEGMNRFQASSPIQLYGCCLFTRLGQIVIINHKRANLFKGLIVNLPALTRVLQVIEQFPNNDELLIEAFDALGSFYSIDVMLSMTSNQLFTYMERYCYLERVQANGCNFLSFATSGMLQYLLFLLISKEDNDHRVVARIIEAMNLFPESDEVQMEACNAINNSPALNEENLQLLVTHGGIGIVLTAMRNHPKQVDVQRRAVKVLCFTLCKCILFALSVN